MMQFLFGTEDGWLALAEVSGAIVLFILASRLREWRKRRDRSATMPHIRIVPHGDGQLPELAPAAKEGRMIHVLSTITVAGLAGGMESGAPSVAIICNLPDGRVVFAETSLRLFLSAADALRAAHGDPRIDSVAPGETMADQRNRNN